MRILSDRDGRTLPWQWDRGARRWAAGALVATAYTAIYVVGVITSDADTGTKVASVALLTLLAVVYVLLPGGLFGAPIGYRWGCLAVIVLVVLAQLPLMGADAVGLLIFPGVAAAIMLPMRQALAVALTLGAAMIGISWNAAGGPQWELALTEVALSLWMAGFARNIRLNEQLRSAQQELARSAVLAERERIARDLHDILGHSLTAITVKAALARQLAGRAPEKVLAEVNDIENLARSALADVRATASGIRERSLAGELAAARSVLTAAGITPVMPGAVDDVAPAGRELFGYVVKEAVTNVVRHSGAANCTVRLGPDWVEIIDDGTGRPTAERPDSGGSGLCGLQERVSAAGGTLVTGNTVPSGFSVRAELTTIGGRGR
ncbi:sensor histidine kinase [Nakamurella lactea]|uniref:sensor histidine kinase n=1 Tax=Nakamurella lactea TaxID=459515 RepID=UPI0004223C47|nr:sensor histidine kinase [Nakamurella lactea]